MNENKKCRHRIAPNVFFGGKELIDMEFVQGHYEFDGNNGNKQNIKLQFCTKCGVVLVKL